MKKLLLTILFLTTTVFANDDDFRWQDGSREMDGFLFNRAFIDSVKNLHLGENAGQAQRGLRRRNPGTFSKRETLVYDVSWGGIRAGFLIIETSTNRERSLYRVSSKAMTNNFVSNIYRVRDHAVSWIDAQGLYPRFFEHHVREGRSYRMDSYIIYDNVSDPPQLYQRRRNDVQSYETQQFTHDFLSALTYVRARPLAPGDDFSIPIFSRPQTYPFRFRVNNRRETIRVPAGTFNCLKIDPTLAGDSRVFNRRDRMEVWISDDAHRYPVQVRSRITVGSITARLIHISN